MESRAVSGSKESGKEGLEVNDEDEYNVEVNFYDIVDLDEKHYVHLYVGWVLESLPGRGLLLLFIAIHCIVVGLHTNEYLARHYGSIFLVLDEIFLTIFIIDIIIKWHRDFLGFWRAGWNIFDFVLVGLSLLVPGFTFFSGAGVLNIVQVLHALRSLKTISSIRGLQTVMQTVIYSIPDIANVAALLFICIFVFAILGHSLFGDDCTRYFGSLEQTMFSLFICVTQDGWLRIVDELNNCGNSVLGPIYLVIFITIGTFILANLVIAVVVTNLEWVIAKQNEELAIKKQEISVPKVPGSTSGYDLLFELAYSGGPLQGNPEALENYYQLLSSLEENLVEFRRIKNELALIQQQIEALETLDSVTNDELLELSTMVNNINVAKSYSAPNRKTSGTGGGDAISEMMGMLRNNPAPTGQPTSIRHMITQLMHPAATSDSSSRRNSYLSDLDNLGIGSRPQSPAKSRVSDRI